MKIIFKWIPLLTLGLVLSISNSTQAQEKYVLGPSPEMKISGGSTLHDWDMISNQAQGEGQFVMKDNKLQGIKSLEVSMDPETLKSGKSGMDNNAYKALNTKKHKNVSFKLNEITGSGSAYQAKGDFTIAGVTKTMAFPVKVTQSGEQLNFEGSFDTKLTHFSVEPPTALLGTVKTEDNITIAFKGVFQPTK